MSEFTRGPWTYDQANDAIIVTHEYGEDDICNMPQWGDSYQDEKKANAHLIAAAPDMYEALSIICDYLEMDGRGEGVSRIGRAALAKARGE